MDIVQKLDENIGIFILPKENNIFNNFTEEDISLLKAYPLIILPKSVEGDIKLRDSGLLSNSNLTFARVISQVSSQSIFTPEDFDYFYKKYRELLKYDNDKPKLVTFFNFDNVMQLRTSIIALREITEDVPFITFHKFNSSGLSDDGFSIFSFMEVICTFERGYSGFIIDDSNIDIIEIIQDYNYKRKLPIAVYFDKVSEQNIDRCLSNLLQLNIRVISFDNRRSLNNIRKLNPESLRKKVDIGNTLIHTISGLKNVVHFGDDYQFVKIGERINPTNRKTLSEAIKNSNIIPLLEEARQQVENEADCLDINLGVPGVDQGKIFLRTIVEIQNNFDVPLFIDSDREAIVEDCLKVYNGKPTINSINAKKESYEKLLPIVKKYGSMIILLTIGDRLPESTRDRIEILERMLRICQEYKISFDKIIVDPVVLSVGTDQNSAKATLEAISIIKREFGLPTIVGLSNVSFGLPQRKYINRTFLVSAIMMGLDGAIFNPLDKEIHNYIASASGLSGRDINFSKYIKRFRKMDIDFDLDLDL